MPKRFCQCPGCASCGAHPGNHNALFDLDSTGTLRCPPCQATATTARNSGPANPAYADPLYRRNRPIIVQQARNGRPCHICDEPIGGGDPVTVEHVIPLRQGGTHDLANLAPAHSPCNTAWNKNR